MIRKQLFVVFTLAFLVAGCKQEKQNNYFIGTVEYYYTYSSDSLNVDSLTRIRPDKGFFRYDSLDYQSKFTGKDTVTYYYSGKINKAVGASGSGEYECEDYSVASDSVTAIRVYDTDEKILGYSCGVIEMHKTRSWVQYYFAKELIMAPGTYQKHKAFNWDTYGIKTKGGLVLKVKHQFKNFTMTGVATTIRKSNNNFRALELSDEEVTKICKQSG